MLPSLLNQGVRVYERGNVSPTRDYLSPTRDYSGGFQRASSGGESTGGKPSRSPPPPYDRRLSSRMISPVPVFHDFRERSRILPWLWVLALLVLLAGGLFAARTYLGGNVRSLQDQLMESKESLLQSQDRSTTHLPPVPHELVASRQFGEAGRFSTPKLTTNPGSQLEDSLSTRRRHS